MINNEFVKEISKKANITEEEVLDGINNLSIDIFENKEEAFINLMALEELTKEELLKFFMPIMGEKMSNTSPLEKWISEYDGLIDTPFGVAYINQSFYN